MREQRRKQQQEAAGGQGGQEQERQGGASWMGGGEWISVGELGAGECLDEVLAGAGSGEWVEPTVKNRGFMGVGHARVCEVWWS